MAHAHHYLAIDLGAESGRAMLASLDSDKLTLQEVHRFGNGPVRLPDGLHWDVLRLWGEIKIGIAAACKSAPKLESLGLDTWGVDFALLDRDGGLLGNPHHYRDARTDGLLEEAFKLMPRAEIFANTGIQFLQINTLYQLLALVRQKSPLLDAAHRFVTIPDLFNYWLSGQISNEFTNATTTQCFDPRQRNWARPVLDALGIPAQLFGDITESGTVLGQMLPAVAEETDAGPLKVITPACHDTGSAVVSVLADGRDFAWLSSGTWSIMGTEIDEPSLSEKTLEYNFTNEGGVFGTWRLSKNIMGLWVIQECRRSWQHEGSDMSYDEISRLAGEATPFAAVIDPDADDFFHSGDMPERIRQYCQRTGQPVRQSVGSVARIVFESLALKYRWVLERLEELTGKRLDPIYMIGGGVSNKLLNQFTADATGRRVVAGPREATAIGNVLVQAIALGHLAGLSEARAVVRAAFPPEEYQPARHAGWDEAYTKLLSLLT